MHNLCRVAAEKGYKIFIYGAKEEVNKKATERRRKMYEGIKIIGRSNGYVSKDKMEDLIQRIIVLAVKYLRR